MHVLQYATIIYCTYVWCGFGNVATLLAMFAAQGERLQELGVFSVCKNLEWMPLGQYALLNFLVKSWVASVWNSRSGTEYLHGISLYFLLQLQLAPSLSVRVQHSSEAAALLPRHQCHATSCRAFILKKHHSGLPCSDKPCAGNPSNSIELSFWAPAFHSLYVHNRWSWYSSDFLAWSNTEQPLEFEPLCTIWSQYSQLRPYSILLNTAAQHPLQFSTWYHLHHLSHSNFNHTSIQSEALQLSPPEPSPKRLAFLLTLQPLHRWQGLWHLQLRHLQMVQREHLPLAHQPLVHPPQHRLPAHQQPEHRLPAHLRLERRLLEHLPSWRLEA